MEQQTIKPTSLSYGMREMNWPAQALSTFASLPTLYKIAKGDGHPVILLPGFGASEYSLQPLIEFLNFHDHQAMSWGLGRNTGELYTYVEQLRNLVDQQFTDSGQRVSLIGWSLGGVVVREFARQYPEKIRQVITMGTPIVGGPKYTTLASVLGSQFGDMDVLEKEIEQLNRQGLKVPVTSIYSKLDGIVPWKVSVDTFNAHAENIEVVSTHIGLGFHPKVYRIITDQLVRHHS